MLLKDLQPSDADGTGLCICPKALQLGKKKQPWGSKKQQLDAKMKVCINDTTIHVKTESSSGRPT